MEPKLYANKKGFTVIELLVVIAIIAVLAAIVSVYIVKYEKKGDDAAIKGNMATLLTNGTIYFTGHGATYSGFDNANTGCSTEGHIYKAIEKIGSKLYCGFKKDDTAWCGCAQLLLTSDDFFCVDSTGVKKETTTSCTGTPAECQSGPNEGYCH